MAIGAFPAAKLGGLLLRQVSKPLANFIIARAKNHPVFRKYVCMPPAQIYNWFEIKTKMWILNLGKPVNIPVLNEQMAIELGANLLGEGIIFTIAAIILINEYNRSARKEAAKEAAKEKEFENLTNSLRDLAFQLEEQRVQMKELYRFIGHLDSTVEKKPQPKKPKPDEPQDQPPASSPPLITPHTSSGSLVVSKFTKSSLLMKAVNVAELEFLNGTEKDRETGILTRAVNHLYREVYRLPLTMS